MNKLIVTKKLQA